MSSRHAGSSRTGERSDARRRGVDLRVVFLGDAGRPDFSSEYPRGTPRRGRDPSSTTAPRVSETLSARPAVPPSPGRSRLARSCASAPCGRALPAGGPRHRPCRRRAYTSGAGCSSSSPGRENRGPGGPRGANRRSRRTARRGWFARARTLPRSRRRACFGGTRRTSRSRGRGGARDGRGRTRNPRRAARRRPCAARAPRRGRRATCPRAPWRRGLREDRRRRGAAAVAATRTRGGDARVLLGPNPAGSRV